MASFFWYTRTSADTSQFQFAAQLPGSTQIGKAASFSATPQTWPVEAAALGNRRYAVIRLSGDDRTSAVVDLSSPDSPSLSAPVTLSMLRNAQVVSTPANGAFIVGPDVPAGAINMGGGITAQGRPIETPDGYKSLWWSAFSPLEGGPTAWWVFSASKIDPLNAFASDPRIYLGLLALDDGWLGTLEDRIGATWNENSNNPYQCADYNSPRIDVSDYGKLRAVVGWTQRKATADEGCEIVVDGQTLTEISATSFGKPILGGTDAGPLAIWEEHDVADKSNVRSRIVWQARDDRTGTWGITSRLSAMHTRAEITSRATAPGGLVAFTWLGCDDNNRSRCTSYLTKVVQGVWSTQSLGTRGPTTRYSTQVAINTRGEAIAIWSFDMGEGCTQAQSEKCARIFGFRF